MTVWGNDFHAWQPGKCTEKNMLKICPGQKTVLPSELDSTAHMVLDQTPERLAVGGRKVLLVRAGNRLRLRTGEFVLRKMTIHFVPIEVSIVRVAICIVHPNGLLGGASEDTGAVGHDTRLVQCRLVLVRKGT
jgi:hypothetical protein